MMPEDLDCPVETSECERCGVSWWRCTCDPNQQSDSAVEHDSVAEESSDGGSDD